LFVDSVRVLSCWSFIIDWNTFGVFFTHNSNYVGINSNFFSKRFGTVHMILLQSFSQLLQVRRRGNPNPSRLVLVYKGVDRPTHDSIKRERALVKVTNAFMTQYTIPIETNQLSKFLLWDSS
jgi:hypothetical protein